MLSTPRAKRSAGLAPPTTVLCSSAAIRLIWAVGALAVLWAAVFWALD